MIHKEFKFLSWCVENRVTVYVFTTLITLAGILTYQSLPKEQFPDIVVPTILVTTIYPGTSPEDVENLISREIEKQVRSLKGVKKVTSNSIQDFSMVMVEFRTGIDPAVAKQRVSDAVDKARNELPTDLDNDPVVQEVDFSEFPIMQVNLAGDFPLDRLKKYADLLKDEVETLPEITRADIIGAPEREIQVDVDLYKLQAAGLSFGDIEGAVARENVNISGGDLNVYDIRRTLRVTGEFKKVEDVANLIVRGARGQAIFLKDIANVHDGFKEKQDYARLNGKSVISLSVIKRSGENLINASDKIQETVAKMQADKFPAGLEVSITGDQSDFTRQQLKDLIDTIILGFIFVLFVLMFFMGTTNAFFVALSVPLSALLAFLFMPSLGFSLNVVVMFSFLLALGIVVDDAIVVIENTHRIFHANPEKGVLHATKQAASEVFIPVLSGTMTNIAPFFPLLFWPGLVGEFMKYLPITLIITLFASLFVAFVMNTTFAVSFMKSHEEEHGKPFRKLVPALIVLVILALFGYASGSILWGNLFVIFALLYVANQYVFTPLIAKFQNTALPAFMDAYRALLRWVISGYKPLVLVAGSFVLLIVTFVLMGRFAPPVVFFPEGDPNFVYVYLKMPIGTDATVTDSVTRIAERKVLKVLGKANPDVKSIISNVGIGAGDPQNPDRVVAPNKGKVSVAFKRYAERTSGVSSREYLNRIRAEMVGIPAAEITVAMEEGGPPTGKPINVEITGEDFTVMKNLETEVRRRVSAAGIKGYEELKSDLQLNKPEIIIDIDREKAQREGISTAQIALEIRTALYGKEVSQFRDNKEEYPIMVRLDTNYRHRMEEILNLPISYLDMASGRFRQVPMRSLVAVRYATSFSQINRKNQQRVNNLSSELTDGYTANEVVAQINDVISEIDVPSGYSIKMTGEQEDQKETSDFLGLAAISAILLMFLILVIQFNSVVKPLMIFATVILSLIGVLAGFMLTQKTISIVMTGVGVIALWGIVVKNGIILIEFMDELRNRGYSVREAIIEGATTRLTPVLLTASAAILGLIPLGLGMNINFETLIAHGDPQFYTGGDSGVFWGPLAWAIIFGLTFTTFLTLIIVPSMYYGVERFKARVLKRGALHEERIAAQALANE